MKLLYTLVLLVSVAAPVAAQRAPTDTLPLDPNVTVGKLPNGLRYYIRVNRKPEARAELRLAGCPGLAPQSWKQVLEEEGFLHVLFPAEAQHRLGQQIVTPIEGSH